MEYEQKMLSALTFQLGELDPSLPNQTASSTNSLHIYSIARAPNNNYEDRQV